MELKVLTVLCCITLVNSASLSATEQKKYKQLIEGQGLYSREDDVEIFTATNFKSIYGQKKAVLIEFYNSWCGFCQRFAPSWKALATDLLNWRDLVTIGAIDCSDEDNSPICREFEILGYPTLRYFHENYQEGPKQLGIDVLKGENLQKIRENLVKRLITEQTEDRGKHMPALTEYKEQNLDNVFDKFPNANYIFVIVENATVISAEIALDFHNVKEIGILSVTSENKQIITNQHILSYPTVLLVNKDKSIQNLTPSNASRETVHASIKDFLKNKGISTPVEPPKELFSGQWLQNKVPDIAALLEARERQALLQRVNKMGDVVFQMDLETALRSALKHEVATTKIISGEKMTALQNFLNVILKYFPMGTVAKDYFAVLRAKVDKDSITGEEIAEYLKPIDQEDSGIFSSAQNWLACAGSSLKYRGYPCGMWKMFHYLTVNAAEVNAGNPEANPKEVLSAMLGYIKNYFGCSDCSKHFQEMALKNDLNGVSELNSSIIWLWIAHNDVNKRLAGDQTEDPEHPKIQFPSKENCPKCRNGEKWDLHEVLQYLRHMYSSINVRYLGSDTKVLHDGLGHPRPKRSTGAWEVINRMDVSLCFVLYVLCFILLLVLVRLFLKKGYKKKLYVHDLLGKV